MKKLDRVFIGITKDGKERCLYKKNKSFSNGVNYTQFVDLESKESFDYRDLKNLRSFKDTIRFKKKDNLSTKRKIINCYKFDREKLIDIRNIVVGDLIKVKSKINIVNGTVFIEQYKNIVMKDIVLKKLNHILYEDISDGRVYYNIKNFDSRIYNGNCVDNIKNFEYNDIDKIKEKKKVLELINKNK